MQRGIRSPEEAAMGRWFIDAGELAAEMADGTTVVVDCRFSLQDAGLGARQYAEGHVPGSHYAHLDRDLSGPRGAHGGRHPLPAADALAAVFSGWGIDSNPPTRVVVYDDSRFAFAARLWWLLRYCGHDDVRVLDGGFRAWTEAGLPVTQDVPTSRTGNFVPCVRSGMVVDREQVIALRGRFGHSLVDSRESPRFEGLEEPIDPHAGHIKGACNHPWQQVTDKRGRFAPHDVQLARWGDTLAMEDIVVYCGSGVTACVNLLSLAELGRDDARLYAGSWSDWCSYF
jgi:thiosulfate/3-mercaptopyruvate sulfurtransferase